ncbi:hypothetical protein ILUMI_22294 [Ignelater luminosus]|uniref:Major facilitator superfamily (MFS) profile domain-containing protein n=1 Tax=Ignelater luminosus TaxID=2038154 RepID=A0A8K0CD33_IGNLU|nr:hypothetical protein ILUMI_22294 [Ignelater luminosus]
MNKYLKLFFRRIVKDFQQKELLPLKLLFFIHASTIFVIYPYLTIHMRELGINVEETAIMSAITPVVSILMPPVAGLIADKIGNFKILLALFSALGGASALLFLLVPVGRITLIYPEQVIFGVSCISGSPLRFSMFQEHSCTPLHPYTYETEMRLESCGFVCQAFANENDSQAILNVDSYGVQFHNIKANTSTTIIYEMNIKKNITIPPDNSWITRKVLKNDEEYSKSVRKLSKHSYYFPTPSLYNFSCGITDDLNDTYDTGINNTSKQGMFSCVFGSKDQLRQLSDAFGTTFSSGILAQKPNADDIAEERQFYNAEYIKDDSSIRDSVCLESFPKNKEYISVNVPLQRPNETTVYKTLDLGSCAARCLATSPRKSVCSNKDTIQELNVKLTFWSYLAVRVFIGMISGTAFAMFEGAVIAILREHKADYGLQRIYATIGGMISSPLSGWLIDFASKGKGYTDFRPIFFLYASLKIVSAVLMLFMNLEFKTPASNVISDVFSVLRKVELIALFIAIFILGTAWGYIESFLFWLIQDLGGTKSLMGITITVGGIAGIPLLVLSGPIIKRIGHANVLFIGFVFYAIRLLGYSLIYDPWLCLIFEAMESITSSLSFTAAVTYAAKLSTITTDTSIQGMLGGLYYGVGKGAGSLIGGYSMKTFGTRATYRIFAAAAAITGILYFIFNHFYMKKRPSEGTDITKKDPVKPPQNFVDVDLKPVANGMQQHDHIIKEDALPYEDALTNLGYEDTESDPNTQQTATPTGGGV